MSNQTNHTTRAASLGLAAINAALAKPKLRTPEEDAADATDIIRRQRDRRGDLGGYHPAEQVKALGLLHADLGDVEPFDEATGPMPDRPLSLSSSLNRAVDVTA